MEFADISNHQASFDPVAYKAAGHSIISHKSSEGTGYTDPYFVQRTQAAHAAGLQVWAYHFLHGDGEAAYFLDVCKPVMGMLSVLMLDFEADATAEAALSFCREVQAANTGKQLVIYAGYYKITGTGLTHPAGWDWVVSDYNPTLNVGIPAGWPAAAYWQYTDCGVATGISGTVDLNRETGAPLQSDPVAMPEEIDEMAKIVQVPGDTREWVATATSYYYLQGVPQRNDLVRLGLVPSAVPTPIGKDTLMNLVNLRPDLQRP